jgi:hypothetical protein
MIADLSGGFGKLELVGDKEEGRAPLSPDQHLQSFFDALANSWQLSIHWMYSF